MCFFFYKCPNIAAHSEKLLFSISSCKTLKAVKVVKKKNSSAIELCHCAISPQVVYTF